MGNKWNILVDISSEYKYLAPEDGVELVVFGDVVHAERADLVGTHVEG